MHPHPVFQSVVMLLQMYHFFFGRFLFKSNLNPSAFFSILRKSLILIHEFTSPTHKQKGSPTPARYKAARFAESVKGRCGRPLVTQPRACEAPAPAAPTRRPDPSRASPLRLESSAPPLRPALWLTPRSGRPALDRSGDTG